MISDMIPSWATWNDGTIPKLAQVIYDGKRLDLLPILADALEEAGHPDQTLPLLFRSAPPWHRAIRAMAPLLGGEVEGAVKWMEAFVTQFKGSEERTEEYTNYRGETAIDVTPANPDMTYDLIMDLAVAGEGIVQHGSENWRSIWHGQEEQFWQRYKIITKDSSQDEKESYERFYFDCSC